MIEAEKQKLENEKKRLELVQAYKRLFMTDDGKRVLQDLENFCGFNATSVAERSPNTLQTFFAEGKRRVYLRINGFIRKETDDGNT